MYLGEAARTAHKALYSLDDACYVPASENIISTIMSVTGLGMERLHVSADWKSVLKVALWTSGAPPRHAVMDLLKKAGAEDHELGPFRDSDPDHFFPWLYYDRRFDILRRICRAAKAAAEARIEGKVYIHLVSCEEARIVASSL